MKTRMYFTVALFYPILLFSQINSWDGYDAGFPSDAKIRALNIFINVIYDSVPSKDPCKGMVTTNWL